MWKLTIDQIEEGRRKVLENALELLDEAELLYSKRRYSRAFALAHLACEELAKLPMLVRAGVELAVGLDVDWHRLRKRMASHSHKIKNVHLSHYMSSPSRGGKAVRKVFDALCTSGELAALKNKSLYVDLHGHSFKKPSETLNEVDAKVCISRARQLSEWFQSIESLTRGKLRNIDGTRKWRSFGSWVRKMVKDKDISECISSVVIGRHLLQALFDLDRPVDEQ